MPAPDGRSCRDERRAGVTAMQVAEKNGSGVPPAVSDTHSLQRPAASRVLARSLLVRPTPRRRASAPARHHGRQALGSDAPGTGALPWGGRVRWQTGRCGHRAGRCRRRGSPAGPDGDRPPARTPPPAPLSAADSNPCTTPAAVLPATGVGAAGCPGPSCGAVRQAPRGVGVHAGRGGRRPSWPLLPERPRHGFRP